MGIEYLSQPTIVQIQMIISQINIHFEFVVSLSQNEQNAA